MSKAKTKSAAGGFLDAGAEEITIRAEPIELSQLLKFAGLFDSGGEAKHAIQHGQVQVNGVVEKTVRKKLGAGTVVVCAGRTLVVRV